MQPIEFPEVNCTYAKNQPPYIPLPVCKLENEQGEVISCWKLSFRERLAVLFKGKMWLSMWTFHKPLTPVRPFVETPTFQHQGLTRKSFLSEGEK